MEKDKVRAHVMFRGSIPVRGWVSLDGDGKVVRHTLPGLTVNGTLAVVQDPDGWVMVDLTDGGNPLTFTEESLPHIPLLTALIMVRNDMTLEHASVMRASDLASQVVRSGDDTPRRVVRSCMRVFDQGAMQEGSTLISNVLLLDEDEIPKITPPRHLMDEGYWESAKAHLRGDDSNLVSR